MTEQTAPETTAATSRPARYSRAVRREDGSVHPSRGRLMAMTVNCPSCQKALRVSEEFQGQKMRCAACQQVFVVPTSPSTPQAPPSYEQGPSGGGYNQDPEPPPPPRRPRDDYDEPPR